MARVTVEDCIRQVPSRFRLILMAAARSRQILSGQPLLVERDHDRDAIVALREIAEAKITADEMNETIINDLLRPTGIEESTFDDNKQLAPDAPGMSEEEMLKSLTDLEARSNQSPYQTRLADSEEREIDNISLANFKAASAEAEAETATETATARDIDEPISAPTDEMIAEEEMRIAEEALEESLQEEILQKEDMPEENAAGKDFESQTSDSDKLPPDESGEGGQPSGSDDTAT